MDVIQLKGSCQFVCLCNENLLCNFVGGYLTSGVPLGFFCLFSMCDLYVGLGWCSMDSMVGEMFLMQWTRL